MRVIISCGLGPLHFVSSARSLVRKVDCLRFICGYIPNSHSSILLKMLAMLRGKRIDAAIRKRRIETKEIVTSSCCIAEALNQFFLIVARLIPSFYSAVEKIAWTVYGWQSKRYIKNADVFHVRSGAGHGGAIALARERGMKVIVDHSIAHPQFMDENMKNEFERNGKPFNMGMSNSFWKMIDDECKMADIVLVNSEFVKKTFMDAGYDESCIRVVYLGVRNDFWGVRRPRFLYGVESRTKLKLLFTGGFGFRKGAEYLMKACKMLFESNIPFELDVVGDFTDAKDLISQYEDFKLPITYHGQMPQDELKRFLSDSDIYVFPSLAEGCAQSGMEALAAGLCVIGTYESGFPIKDGETGFVVPSKDERAIADKIMWLDQHREEIDRVGASAAKMMCENFTWDNYAGNVKKIYEELLNE